MYYVRYENVQYSYLPSQLLIGYLDVSDEEEGGDQVLMPWHGLGRAAALVALGLLCSMAETHSFFQLNVAGLKVKSAVAAAVFRKAMTVKQPRGTGRWVLVKLLHINIWLTYYAFINIFSL